MLTEYEESKESMSTPVRASDVNVYQTVASAGGGLAVLEVGLLGLVGGGLGGVEGDGVPELQGDRPVDGVVGRNGGGGRPGRCQDGDGKQKQRW